MNQEAVSPVCPYPPKKVFVWYVNSLDGLQLHAADDITLAGEGVVVGVYDIEYQVTLDPYGDNTFAILDVPFVKTATIFESVDKVNVL